MPINKFVEHMTMVDEKYLKWYKLAHDYELPSLFPATGKVRTIKVNNQKFCVGRLSDGYFAIRDFCPHAGASLGKGRCDGDGNVICPLHDIKFNLRDGKNTTGEGYYMQTFAVKETKEGLYIGLDNRKWYEFWK